MKCFRSCRFVAALAVFTAAFVAVVVAKDAQPKPAVTPASRPDAWWQQRHEGMNARVKQGNVDLLFIGDSITQGWEGDGKDVWREFYGKRNAVNLGIGGDETQHVLWRLDHGNIDGIAPKLAVMMIGTNNNNTQSSTPEQIAEGIEAIVEKLRTKLPNTKILLLGIFPRGADNNDHLRQINVKVNGIISKLADDKTVFYLDIGPKFLAADGTLSKEVMHDLLHLNAKSYETWAEAIEPMVAKLMGEADNQPGAAVTPAPPKSMLHRRVHEKINARVKQGHVDLIFIGDSITHFWTSEGYWKNDGTEVWNKFYGKRNAVNMGVRGDWTQHVLWRLDHGNIDGIAPKLAVLMIGTNPIGTDLPEDIAEGVKAIVEKLRAKLPQTKVLLLGLLPRGETQEDRFRQLTAKTNEIISKLADGKTVFYLDIGPKFLNADGTLDKEILPDLVHPNAKGYEIWAAAIEPTVAKLMGEK